MDGVGSDPRTPVPLIQIEPHREFHNESSSDFLGVDVMIRFSMYCTI